MTTPQQPVRRAPARPAPWAWAATPSRLLLLGAFILFVLACTSAAGLWLAGDSMWLGWGGAAAFTLSLLGPPV